MVEKVHAWQASDGFLSLDEQEAKDHEFKIALADWFTKHETILDAGAGKSRPMTVAEIQEYMFMERAKLLGIFKLLNGGNGPVAKSNPAASEV